MEENNNHIIKNSILFIIATIIIMITILACTNTSVYASLNSTWNTSRRMPNFDGMNPYTGLVPMKVAERTVNFFGNNVNIGGETIYCAKHGTYLRNGKYTSNRLYITSATNVEFDYETGDPIGEYNEGMNWWQNGNTGIQHVYAGIAEGDFLDDCNDYISHGGTIDKSTIVNDGDVDLNGDIDKARKMFYDIGHDDMVNKLLGLLQAKIKDLSSQITPAQYDESVDPTEAKTYAEKGFIWNTAEGKITGPEIVVMETDENNHISGYKEGATKEYINNKEAYILTATENMYGGEIGKKYTEEDIQHAYWLCQNNNTTPSNNTTPMGKHLFDIATKYEEFVKIVSNNGYNTNLEYSNAKVIANRENQTYIVGPFKLDYLQYEDVSYIKSMTITTDTGRTLNISENSQDFNLILESGGRTDEINGITKVYPKNGEHFFIQFSANSANYPKNIALNVEFEYLGNTYAKYTELTSRANIYHYVGYVNEGTIVATLNNNIDIVETVPDCKYGYQQDQLICDEDESYPNCGLDHKHDYGCYHTHDSSCYHDHTDECFTYTDSHSNHINNTKEYPVYQPYVVLEPVTSAEGQPLIDQKEGNRAYANQNASASIDLSMELGGYVWSDSTGGKESLGNNIKDNEDIPMPHVLVTLFKADGTQIGTTKTDEDGRYIFKNLNAMYQYYVRFTYNGQYYQPVVYRTPNVTDKNAEQYKYGWYGDSWSVSSNGADVRTQRTEYNAKFASIGSSPANYYGAAGWNETFTKQQLLGMTLKADGTYEKTREAVIDEFGNLILENSQDLTTRKMIQYVKDCQMNSYTGSGDGTVDLYPVPSLFIIDNVRNIKPETSRLILSMLKINVNDRCLYDNAYYINQGLVEREKADLAIKKDVEKVRVEINGQTHDYGYDTKEGLINADGTWEIGIRLSDNYYKTNYSRELYKSDYLYKVSLYGADPEMYGKDKSDELEVYVTYKIMVRNQSQSIRCRVDELVDYYDSDYEFVDNRSYITFRTGDRKGNMYSVKNSATSKYTQPGTTTNIDGYNSLYIQGLGQNAQAIDAQGNNVGNEITDGIYLNSGETAYIYLTYRVKKDNINNEDWVKLDEKIETAEAIGVGKENIIEINGYSTLYKEGTMIPNVGYADANTKAGLVDKDSNPGNLNPNDVPKDGTIKYENFEDDTDKAPNIKLVLLREGDDADRVISGVVWEDERTKQVNNATIGDGQKQDKETLIDGVTVQLVELMDNGMEYVWREFGSNEIGINTIGKGTGSGTKTSETPIINAFNLVSNYEFGNNQKGAYAFKSFAPGKYVIRFIYGDTIRTVLPNNVGGLNEKSYNGQDYKSTTYQNGVTQNKTYTWRSPSTWANGQETLGDILAQIVTFKSDASNNETANVSNGGEKGYLYDITASENVQNISDAKDIESRRNEVVNYSDNNVKNNVAEILASFKKDPINQEDIKVLMENTHMMAETGMMVIELEKDRINTAGQTEKNSASYKITGVDLGLEQRPQAQLVIDKKVTNVKLTLADGSILFDSNGRATNLLWHEKSSYIADYNKNILQEVRKQNANNPYGLIQMSMDEEIMHGATIKISYDIIVKNVGEVDYKENKFYYTGTIGDKNTIVKTKVDKVIDYVANNLQFYKADNADWNIISNSDVLDKEKLVNKSLEDKVNKYNAIIVTEKLSQELVPEISNKAGISEVKVPLVLTQLITSENTTDDLTYRNIVEIVETSNTAGRRMAFSIVGNQDPTIDPTEVDSDRAEIVKILPPFGNAGLPYIIAGIIAMIVIVIMSGVIFIKKKVLTR